MNSRYFTTCWSKFLINLLYWFFESLAKCEVAAADRHLRNARNLSNARNGALDLELREVDTGIA